MFTVNQSSKDTFVQIWSNNITCSSEGYVNKVLKSNLALRSISTFYQQKLKKDTNISYIKPSSICRDGHME